MLRTEDDGTGSRNFGRSSGKHVPSYVVDGNKVKVTVGSVEHPMVENHYIEWIAVETEKGAQRKTLNRATSRRWNSR